MKVLRVERDTIKTFIESNHYSGSINGCKVSHCFALLLDDGSLVGAVLFGSLSTTAWKKYAENEKEVIELRRLVCLDSCPKNTESWLIAKCLKAIKAEKAYKVCVSYADPRHGHCGYIYQASNWNYEGQTSSDLIYITPDGKEYHSRALRTKYRGDFKPFVKRLREMKDRGELTSIVTPGKHIYTYSLDRKHRWSGRKYPKLDFSADIPDKESMELNNL